MSISIKRAYDSASPDDGYRLLVDRIWPRGVSKASLKLDQWLKDVSPSTELRKWFNHDPAKFAEFKTRYRSELSDSGVIDELKDIYSKHQRLTLVYGAKDEKHNNAVVLQEILSA